MEDTTCFKKYINREKFISPSRYLPTLDSLVEKWENNMNKINLVIISLSLIFMIIPWFKAMYVLANLLCKWIAPYAVVVYIKTAEDFYGNMGGRKSFYRRLHQDVPPTKLVGGPLCCLALCVTPKKLSLWSFRMFLLGIYQAIIFRPLYIIVMLYVKLYNIERFDVNNTFFQAIESVSIMMVMFCVNVLNKVIWQLEPKKSVEDFKMKWKVAQFVYMSQNLQSTILILIFGLLSPSLPPSYLCSFDLQEQYGFDSTELPPLFFNMLLSSIQLVFLARVAGQRFSHLPEYTADEDRKNSLHAVLVDANLQSKPGV
jgi:hypothetical protein